MSERADFLRAVEEQLGRPYLWNGKGERHQVDDQLIPAFDCSGLVTYALKKATGKDLRATFNTKKMWEEWKPVEFKDLIPGDVALYGDPINHVMVVMPDGRVMGACGGGRHTKHLVQAIASGARVMFKAEHNYRKDLVGYRRPPFKEDLAV